jgi:hypothetical protein
MKKARTLPFGLAGLLGMAFLAVPGARAQEKPAVLPHPSGGEEEVAKPWKGDLRPGHRYALKLKDDRTVKGMLVRGEGGNWFVRTAPGRRPRAIAKNDIDRADVLVPPITQVKNVEDLPPAYEIHRVEIEAGPERTVRYVGPDLSPEERARLRELEAAENEVARVQGVADLRVQVLNAARDLEASRAQAMKQFFNYSMHTSLGFFPATVITFPQPNYAGWSYGGLGYYGGIGYPYYMGALPAYGTGVATVGGFRWRAGWETLPAVSPAAAGSEPGALLAALAPSLLKDASPKSLAEAENALARARRLAVFEDGRIIAVRLDEPEKR